MKWVYFFVCIVIEAACADLFSYLPSSTVPQIQTLQTTQSFNYNDSLWAQWVSVDSVHHITLIHTDSLAAQQWTMGIGKGSQIFSLQGAFGECIPPQNHPGGPWIDEVVQIVSVNREKNNREKIREFAVAYQDTLGNERSGITGCKDSAYFIHQAGTYQRDTVLLKTNNFSPIIAEKRGRNQYATICWPQQAHVHNIHTSQTLYWQIIQDMGNGIIEITYALYNFGETPLNYFNMPWGGVRESTLPLHLLSKSDGSFEEKSGKFGDALLTKLDETDGWALFTQTNKPSSLALSYVFGQDKYLEKLSPQQWDNSYWRYGSSGNYSAAYPGVGPRDFFVALVNPRVSVKKGDLFYWRWYMVVGTQEKVIEQSKELKNAVEYGFLSFDNSEAKLLSLYKGNNTLSHSGNSTKIGTLYDRPTTETQPLFLMRHKQDSSFLIATDPNIHNDSTMSQIGMIYRPYISRYRCEKLLGFATKEQLNKISTHTTTLQSRSQELTLTPIVKSQNNLLQIDNLHSIDALVIYNIMGKEVHRIENLTQSSYSWNHNNAANFLVVKCYRRDRATATIPVTLY